MEKMYKSVWFLSQQMNKTANKLAISILWNESWKMEFYEMKAYESLIARRIISRKNFEQIFSQSDKLLYYMSIFSICFIIINISPWNTNSP